MNSIKNIRAICPGCGIFHDVQPGQISPDSRDVTFKLPIGCWLTFITSTCEECEPAFYETINYKSERTAASHIKSIVSEIHGIFENTVL